MRACRSAHMGGLLHVGRALSADSSVMDRQSRKRHSGRVLVAIEPDRVVSGRDAFLRDPDRLLFQLASRRSDAVCYARCEEALTVDGARG